MKERQLNVGSNYQISFVGEFDYNGYVGTARYEFKDVECSEEYGEFHGVFVLPDGSAASFPISSVGIELNT